MVTVSDSKGGLRVGTDNHLDWAEFLRMEDGKTWGMAW